MPIYEYVCGNCGHELEKLQKVSDKPLVECPHCGQNSLTKQVSATGFRLKGSGWYETDFKSSKETKRNLASSESTESTTKTETKSADSNT